MADTINKPKLQLRATGVTVNGDKTPSPATKLLISHGKPNFTIQKSPKEQNGEGNPLSPLAQNNNYNAFKTANGNSNIVVQSTKFNGVFKPANISVNAKQPHQQTATENEAAKVVLRRAKIGSSEPSPPADDEDASVPEFIRRQRRIQERLAKENVLDFENRRSGYFTHVIVSPTSANRQSFIETMSSPAVVPSLEMPSRSPTPSETRKQETVVEEHQEDIHEGQTDVYDRNGHVEEEEVAKAIEEVNRAVAGEDETEDKIAEEDDVVVAPVATTEVTIAHAEPIQVDATSVQEEVNKAVEPAVVVAAVTTVEHVEVPTVNLVADETTQKPLAEEKDEKTEIAHANVVAVEHVEVVTAAAPTIVAVEEPKPEVPKHEVETPKENGHGETKVETDITISHTNGHTDGPRLPSPDPSGALGVNFEPKTVVSFSKDMNEPNKYPDTVKVVNDVGTTATPLDETLQDLAKLKFEIKTDEEDVQVTQVLRTE